MRAFPRWHEAYHAVIFDIAGERFLGRVPFMRQIGLCLLLFALAAAGATWG